MLTKVYIQRATSQLIELLWLIVRSAMEVMGSFVPVNMSFIMSTTRSTNLLYVSREMVANYEQIT